MEKIRLQVYRYNPDVDAKPYMKDYELEIEPTDVKLLDAIIKLKAQDDSLSFRRSCREGICGSDGMNINGKNGLACLVDIRSLTQPIVLRPLERTLVPTGLFMALPPGVEAQVRPRSGLALKHGITVLNTPGTIDADYRGELMVLLVNFSNEDFVINDGERIAQMVIAQHCTAEFTLVEELDSTERGSGGYGHTGVK